jgi:hypothetical protein
MFIANSKQREEGNKVQEGEVAGGDKTPSGGEGQPRLCHRKTH